MNIYHVTQFEGGYQKQRAFHHISKIGDTIEVILTGSAAEKMPTNVIADRIAQERVQNARKNNGK